MPILRAGSFFVFAAAVIAITLPSSGGAQGFRNPPQDARAMGMANAFVARADNASAIHYNPAGIAFLESPLAVTGNLDIVDPRYKNKTQGFRTNKRQYYIPDGFIATNLLNKYLSFGYGAFSEYGLGTTYPQNSPAAPLGYSNSLKTMDNRFVWALRGPEPFENAAIGGGFDLLYGDLRTKQLIDYGAFTTGVPTGELGRSRFAADGHAFGWNFGGLIKMKRMHQIGINFSSSMDLDADGKLKLSNVPGRIAPVPELYFPASTVFALPAKITWGYLFKPVDWFKTEFDVSWLKYSRFQQVKIKVDDPAGLVQGQTIDFGFRDSWVYALGAELGPCKGFALRGGWSYIQTPVPSSTFNTMIPDSDRNVASVGLGWQYKKFSIDLAYAAVMFSPRKINNTVGFPYTSVNGRWTGLVNQVLLGASYAL